MTAGPEHSHAEGDAASDQPAWGRPASVKPPGSTTSPSERPPSERPPSASGRVEFNGHVVHVPERLATRNRVRGGKHARPRSPGQRAAIEWGLVLVGAIVVVVIVRTFFVQAFYIPSGSMEPTLKKNDRVLVNKLSYDLHGVHRGDIVVFDRPSCTAPGTPPWASCEATTQIKDLIKRVVALPGETVTVQNNHVFINGRELNEPYTHGKPTELLPGCGFPGTYQIPKGDVFVMGDNRTNSTDSRCFGPIPEKIIVGRAFIRVWPLGRVGFL